MLVPSQTIESGVAIILMYELTLFKMVTVTAFDMAVQFNVLKMQVIISPLDNADVLKIEESVPATVPLTNH